MAGKAGIAYVEIKFNPGDLERMMAEAKAAGKEIASDTSDEVNKNGSIWKSLLSNWKLLVPAITAASVALLGFTGNLSVLAPLLPIMTGFLTAALVPFTTLAALLVGFIPPVTLLVGLLGGLGVAFGLAGKRALDGGKAFKEFSSIVKDIKKNFGELTTTLAHDFLPILTFLAKSANSALIYLNKIAHLPLKQAFDSLATTGVEGVQKFLDKIGSFLKKPITLAVGVAFGKDSKLRDALVADWNAIVKFFTSRKIALPIEKWFGKKDFTAVGYRWGAELANAIVSALVAGIQHAWNSGRGGKLILGGAGAGALLGAYLGGPIGAAMGLAIGAGAGAVLNHYWPKIAATARRLGADLKKAIGPDLWNSVVRDSRTFWSNLKDIWGVVKRVFSALGGWKTVEKAIAIEIRVIIGLVDAALKVFNLVVGVVKVIVNIIRAIVGAVRDVAHAGQSVYNKVSDIVGIVKGALTTAWSGVVSAVKSILGPLGTVLSTVEKIASAVGSAVNLGSQGVAQSNTGAHTGGGTYHGHALGGIITRPLTAGNHLFGEAGREAVIPLDNPAGRSALANAMPEVHVYIGGKPIRDEVQVVLKQTARRVTAGSRWG